MAATLLAPQQSAIPPSSIVDPPQDNEDPTNADLFSFIDIWSSYSMPSKASEESHNRTFTCFDEVVNHFKKIAFDKNLENSLADPDYKEKLRQTVNGVVKLNDLMADELREEMETFLDVFNNAFEAHQLCNQYAYDIGEIESSTEEDRTKIIQAREGFQKAKENLMLIQGPIMRLKNLNMIGSRKRKIFWPNLNQSKTNSKLFERS